MENPWLSIPAADYEGHMGAGGAGQLAPLAAIFARVYADLRPPSVALLGCATGNGLEAADPAVTPRILGVDVNAQYLEIARARHSRLGVALELRCADLLECDLGPGAFALIHAALVFEHVEPAPLVARIARWLAPDGVCAAVLQLAHGDPAPAVTPTGFASLRPLSDTMRLVPPDELGRLFAPYGLAELRAWEVPLPGGKAFHVGLYGARPASTR